jgi:hypothetical protein
MDIGCQLNILLKEIFISRRNGSLPQGLSHKYYHAQKQQLAPAKQLKI